MQAKFQPPEHNQNPFRRGAAASSQRARPESALQPGTAKRSVPAEASSPSLPPVGVPFSSVKQRFNYPHTQAPTPFPLQNGVDINQFYKAPAEGFITQPAQAVEHKRGERRSKARTLNDGTSASMRRVSSTSLSSQADVVPYFQRRKQSPSPAFFEGMQGVPLASQGIPQHTRVRHRRGGGRPILLGAVLLFLLGGTFAWVLPNLKGLLTSSSQEDVITPFEPAIQALQNASSVGTPVVLDTLSPGTLRDANFRLNLLPNPTRWPTSNTPYVPMLMPTLSSELHDNALQDVINSAIVNAPAGLRPHIMVLNGQTLQYAGHLIQDPVPSASVIKLPLLYLYGLHVNAGTLSPQDAVYYADRHRVSGSGSWQGEATGNFRSAYQMAEVMIQNSDNSATEMMVEYLGGASMVNQQWRALGFEATRVRNTLPDLEGFNTISPYEMVATLLQLKEHPYFTEETRAMLMGILEGTRNRSIIPALLPPDTLVAHKTGDIGKSLGESALVYLPDGRYYYISMMVERPHNDPAAREFMRQLSKSIWDYYAATALPTQRAINYVAQPTPSVATEVVPELSQGLVPPVPSTSNPSVSTSAGRSPSVATPKPVTASTPATVAGSISPNASKPSVQKNGYYSDMEVF